jgi:hypothetical protein
MTVTQQVAVIYLPVYSSCDIIACMPVEDQAQTLCKACGLCCTGHLFIWAKLRPAELDHAEALGMIVFRSDPRQRGFSQPCPMWHGVCNIYTSPHYPHICRAYKCQLLKDVLGEQITLAGALEKIKQAWNLIHTLEGMLPPAAHNNFRQRFVDQLEAPANSLDADFKAKINKMLYFYAEVFGVLDLLEEPDGT